MLYLSQRDPKWAIVRLGASNLTVGRWGCTTTSISMLTDYFGAWVSPDAIAKQKKNYTKDGLILWNALKFPTMRFVERKYGFNEAAIMESLKDPNKAVILEVNDGQHWVVGVKKNLLGNDFTCIDPWDGKKKNLKAAYRNITGSAHFVRA